MMKPTLAVNNLCLVFVLQYIFCPAQSQPLSVTFSRVKLPLPDYCHRAWYDGKDDVYLFGGQTDSQDKRILRYSVSKDTIHWEGSLPVAARYISIHSDWDGNIIIFGADSGPDDKVVKYSPTTNSSSVVAQLHNDIFGIPTIKLGNKVLILGKWPDYGLEILSFDLADGKTTRLEPQLPVSVRVGAAIRLGKDKAYLFPVKGNGGFMWEMDLPSIAFRKITDIPLPVFEESPSVLTDKTFIYILANFMANSLFLNLKGLLKINPAAATSEFLPLNNWPLGNGSRIYQNTPPAVYVGKMNRIYFFGGRSSSRDLDDIFYIDLKPLPNNKTDKAGNQTVTSGTSTENSTIIVKSNYSTTEGSPETSTITISQDWTSSKVPFLNKEHEFACSNSYQGESSKCTLSENQTDVFCQSILSENVTCYRPSTLSGLQGENIKLFITKFSPGNECDFIINFVLEDIEGRLDCRLENGERLILTIGRDEHRTYLIVFGSVVLLGILVILVTGWMIRIYRTQRKAQNSHVVHWGADKNCEIE